MDLIAALGGCVLLGAVCLPLMGNHTARSEQVACLNNLRLIGQGFLAWSSEFEERYPWMVFRIEPGGGGNPWVQNLWFHYFQLSNHLESPRFLADPGDERTAGTPVLRPARYWDDRPDGGLLHVSYRNNALSYPIGRLALPAEPTSILAMDRNVRASGSHGDQVFGMITTVDARTVEWLNAVHGTSGNLLFSDGRAEETDTPRLKKAVQWRATDHEDFAFPFPPN